MNILTVGTYRIAFRVASITATGKIGLELPGLDPGNVVIGIPDTGGYQTWTTVSTNVNITNTGPQTLQLNFSGSGFSLNWFRFLFEAQPGSTPSPIHTPTHVHTPASPTPLVLTYSIEKISDASEDSPTAGQFRVRAYLGPGAPRADGYLRVPYTISGTALNGVDYQTIPDYVYCRVGSPILPFPTATGVPYDYIKIKPIADDLVEGTETVTITLNTNNINPGGSRSATLYIMDSGATPLSTPVITPAPTPSPIPGSIKLRMYNAVRSDPTKMIAPRFKLYNTGPDPIKLSTVKIRYYYSIDGIWLQHFHCTYSSVGRANITGRFVKMSTPLTTADYYLEIGFTKDAGYLAGGACVEVHVKFAKAGQPFGYRQANDFSFNDTAAGYVNWTSITGYVAGVLQWGLEP